MSKLLWQSDCVERYILRDTDDAFIVEKNDTQVQSRLWDMIAIDTDDDPIKQAGWNSSFTGRAFSSEEMDEYVENTVFKLKYYLNEKMKVLEVGIASGLTCFAIAPQVGEYYGLDISEVTLKKTKKALIQRKIKNVFLLQGEAIDVNRLELADLELVILNSVVQYFPGYNYFLKVIERLIACMSDTGILYIGDVMDYDRKSVMEEKLSEQGVTRASRHDLWYPRCFMQELPAYFREIINVDVSNKVGCIENELKQYRYDVILHIDKKNNKKRTHTKFQYAMRDKNFSINQILNETIEV